MATRRRAAALALGLGAVLAVTGLGPARDVRILAAAPPNETTPTRELYDRLRDATRDADNGIAVHTQTAADGQPQMIVYLGGATFDPDNQFVTRNIPAYLRELNDGQLAAITAALDDATRIMLVGFSQGGMDAQNIAAQAPFKDQVTTVVTFAAPIVAPPGDHHAAHLWDAGDVVPHLTFPWYRTAYRRASASVFERASANDPALVYNVGIPPLGASAQVIGAALYTVQRLALHGQRSTYQQVSHAFDSAPGFAAVKADIGAYLRRQPVD